jgi:1-acyl-sn-glycerol-3-phosphate acyltransferase
MSMEDQPAHAKSQFALFGQRRFVPFFLVQFLGAFNDNLFKNGLTNLITFQAAIWIPIWMTWDSTTLVNFGAMIFILPFFLFSATAGQLADKYEKSVLIRRIKLLEIGIMAFAVVALWSHQLVLLLVLLFLMGLQSSLFGPIKYSYLPQHLDNKELVGGNGLVEMGTFVSILLGTIAAGLLTGLGEAGLPFMMAGVMLVATAGYLASRKVPETPAGNPDLKMNFNPFSQTWKLIKLAKEDRVILLSMMGIAWFWAYGSIYLAQLFGYTRDLLGGNEQVMIVMLTAFSIGIGAGSMICERLSGRRVELGLVPVGAIGILCFGIAMGTYEPTMMEMGDSLHAFLSATGAYQVAFYLFGTGFSGGLFIVTLYSLIQERSPNEVRSQIISAINILDAFAMVMAGAYAIFALTIMDLSIPQLFLATAFMHIAVCMFIFTIVPEFLMRFVVWVLVNTLYRLDKTGLENIPEKGPVLLVCNHVSFVDALVIAGNVRRPVRFVMDHNIFKVPVLSFVFRTAKAIPIAPAWQDEEMLKRAYDRVSEELANDQVVCIFPEGKITKDGELNEFKNGMMQIIERNPVPVVPMALRGLWGSFFSRYYGVAMAQLPRRFWSNIGFAVGKPVAPEQVSTAAMFAEVSALRGEQK